MRSDAVLSAACGRVFTGAVARIEWQGRLVFERAYGTTRADAAGTAVYADTAFDLASLTKLFTATLALRLSAEGKLPLDAPLSERLASWRGGPKSAITPRQLLAHQSGMHSGADYRALLDRNVERFALDRELTAQPGERVIYSDLGFIALGEAIESAAGRHLAQAMRDAFPSPTLGFRPSAARRGFIPATEEDDWRGRVQGGVHDEKAHLMGGVAGHAGLFGTAADVAALTAIYLDAARGRDSLALPRALALEAISEQAADPVLRRGLGWALKTSDDNSCGRSMSRDSFGHTGFVGTCVWADPQRDVQGVLLTNAVYFGRNDIRDLRAAFYEAAIEDTAGAA